MSVELQCPFTWKPQSDISAEKFIEKIEDKLLDVENEEGETTPWTKFILNLILWYEYSKANHVEEATQNMKECERIINDHKRNEQSLLAATVAFKHVFFSCKFFLEETNLRKNILKEIICVEAMERKDEATVWGIACAVILEYGVKHLEQCIFFIEKALKIDPDCGEWHFLLGKVLGRLRYTKSPGTIPGKREMEALQCAVDKSKDPLYVVFLAQRCLEATRWMFFHKYKSDSEIEDMDNMNKKAYELYRRAHESCGDNPYILKSCADGFCRLPKPYKDMNIAKKCIFRALEVAPDNAYMSYVAGMIVREEDSNLAKQYFVRAIENGNFTSCYQLLKMKHKEKESYDPRADIERYLRLFNKNRNRENMFAWLGAFHYYVWKDFNTALEHWLQLFNINKESSLLSDTYVPWNIKNCRINISKIILEETTNRIRDSKCDAEERTKYRSIIQDYEKYRPDLYQEHITKNV